MTTANNPTQTRAITSSMKDRNSGRFQATTFPARTRRWIAAVAAGTSAAAAVTLLCTKLAIWISAGVLTLFGTTMTMGQQASMTAVQASKPEAAILEAAETYRNAVLKQDAETVISLFRDDAVEMPPFQTPVSGRNAIARFYQGSFHSPVKVTGFTFSHTEVSTHGDVAYDVGTYSRSMTTPVGPVEASGPYVVILKQTAGKWQIAYLIYNCDCPPPTKEAHAKLTH